MASSAAMVRAQPSPLPIVASFNSSNSSFSSANSSARALPLRAACKCKAAASNQQAAAASVISSGCDLYELLGVEGGASQSEIKKAYRWLQKRCHPDVAGDVAGHDMAVLLNDAYAILSNPATRSSYDKVRTEWIQYQGYTGEPLYSRWLGPSYEERAVFVDEARCVGCLKCALIASNTFAVERRFGRARAVGQWGDPEYAIEDAMRACPVDCISWVDRGTIPALEYVMSKQPRSANFAVDNNVGERSVDVFLAAKMFLQKKREFESQKNPSTMATAGAIHARAGQWWKYFVGRSYIPTENVEATRRGALVHQQPSGPYSFSDTKLRALYEAATRRKLGVSKSREGPAEDYWTPIQRPPTSTDSHSGVVVNRTAKTTKNMSPSNSRRGGAAASQSEMLLRSAPLLVSILAGLMTGVTSSQTHLSNTLRIAQPDGPLLRVRQSLRLDETTVNIVAQILSSTVAWLVVTTIACSGAAFFASLLLDQDES